MICFKCDYMYKKNTLTISGFEKSMLINLYLGDLKFVLKVNSVPSLVMY